MIESFQNMYGIPIIDQYSLGDIPILLIDMKVVWSVHLQRVGGIISKNRDESSRKSHEESSRKFETGEQGIISKFNPKGKWYINDFQILKVDSNCLGKRWDEGVFSVLCLAR